jgi:hypothetical protein
MFFRIGVERSGIILAKPTQKHDAAPSPTQFLKLTVNWEAIIFPVPNFKNSFFQEQKKLHFRKTLVLSSAHNTLRNAGRSRTDVLTRVVYRNNEAAQH